MTYAELLQQEIAKSIDRISASSNEDLTDLVWPVFRQTVEPEMLGGGNRVDQLRSWFRKTVDAIRQTGSESGQAVRRILEDKESLVMAERLSYVVSIVAALTPELRDWPIDALLALIVLEIRRLSEKSEEE